MEPYEVLQVQEESNDLSGIFVMADKPIAVFSGNKNTGYFVNLSSLLQQGVIIC